MWLLSFIPDWVFYIILFVGVVGLFASKFAPVFYKTAVLGVSIAFIVVGLFMSGAVHDNNAWKLRVADLEKKVAEASTKSEKENVKIVEKVVVKREYYKLRGNDVIQYVDREIVKYDDKCVIPKEFIEAHNKAATK